VQSYTGDIEGYRNTCASMLDHFAQSERLDDANRDNTRYVVRACSLAPNAVEDFANVVTLAEQLLESGDKSDKDFNRLGTLLYRAGRFEDAIETFEELISICEKEGRSMTSPAYMSFLLAMAHHQSGQHEQAKTWLSKATEQAAQERAKMRNWHWGRRLTLKIFEAEARQLLGVPEQ